MSTQYLLAAGYELGVGRAVPTSAAVVALIGVVVAVLALRRPNGRLAGTAVALGLVGVIAGGVHGANAAGGLGTGNGLAGAVIAVALGLVGTALGGVALARRRVPAAGSRARG